MSFGGTTLTTVLDKEHLEVLPPDDTGPSQYPDVESLSERGLLRLIRANREHLSRLESLELRAMARLSFLRSDDRSVTAELALVLSETEHVMRNRIALADTLTRRLPRTFAALESGTITAHKASKIADATHVLSDELAHEIDDRMRSRLAGKNPGAIRQATVRQIAHVDPDGAEERRQRHRAQRKVELIPGLDGMTTLLADLPDDVALAAYTRIDRDARTLRSTTEPRTMDQLRADVLTDLLLGNGTSASGPRAEIFVHAAATTLAGLDDLPAELEGHGPITAHHARALTHSHNTVLRRVLTDPTTGTPTEVGRTRYRPTTALDDLVRVRDRHCRMPGCHRAAHHSDLDHVTPYAKGGTTRADNLTGLCRNHHRLKDHPGWTYTHDSHGTLTITTPTGDHHTSQPTPLHPQTLASGQASRRSVTHRPRPTTETDNVGHPHVTAPMCGAGR